MRMAPVTTLTSWMFPLLSKVNVPTHFIAGKLCFLTLAGMFGLSLIGSLSPVKLKKLISKFYIDTINAMYLLTNLSPMFPLDASTVNRRMSPFFIYFIRVLIQVVSEIKFH